MGQMYVFGIAFVAFIVTLPLTVPLALLFRAQMTFNYAKKHPRRTFWFTVLAIYIALLFILAQMWFKSWENFSF